MRLRGLPLQGSARPAHPALGDDRVGGPSHRHRQRARLPRAGGAGGHQPAGRGAVHPRSCRPHSRTRRSTSSALSPGDRCGRLPLYARPETANILQTVFKYVFDDNYKYGGLARVELREIGGPFQLLDLRVIPVPVMHGDAEIIGYRMGRFAYLTDFSAVPDESIKMLEGVQVVFLDALRHEPHPTHSTVANSLRSEESR